MGMWKEIPIFVLLVHSVSLSRGNIGVNLENKISNNTSSFLIANNDTGIANKMAENVNSSRGKYNSYSIQPENVKLLAEKLGEALKNSSTRDEVIMISTSGLDNKNTTEQFFEPVILIESSMKNSQSWIDGSSNKNQKTNHSDTIFDQEIAHSQPHPKLAPRDYVNEEVIENIEDFLAIAEYEPQKLDSKVIPEVTKRENSYDETKSQVRSFVDRLPETIHYDVPKRKNVSKHLEKLNEATTSPISTRTNRGRSVTPKEITTPKNELPEQNYQNGKKQYSSSSSLREKVIDKNDGWSRDPRHLKPSLSLADKQSPPEITEKSKIFTDIQESSQGNIEKLRPKDSHLPLPTTSQNGNKNRTPFDRKKDRSVAEPTNIPRTVSRRIDDYLPRNYKKSIDKEPHPVSNERQLDYTTRYNSRSPLNVSRLPEPYPNANPFNQQPIVITKDANEEKNTRSNFRSSEEKPINLITDLPVDDYNKDTDYASQPSRRFSRKPVAIEHSKKEYFVSKTKPTYDDYNENSEPLTPKSYKNVADLNPATPSNQNYEITDQPDSILQNLDSRGNDRKILKTNTQFPVSSQPYRHFGRIVAAPVNSLNVPLDRYQTFDPTKVSTTNKVYNGGKILPETERIIPENPAPRGYYVPTVIDKKTNQPYNVGKSTDISEKQSPRDIYRQQNGGDYSRFRVNSHDSLSSSHPSLFNPERVAHPPKAFKTVGHVKSSDDDEEVNEEEIYSSTLPKQRRAQEVSLAEQQNSRRTNFVAKGPENDSYESHIDVSPSLSEKKSDNYGNRVEPLFIAKSSRSSERHSQPQIHQTRDTRLPIDRYEKQRFFDAKINEQPAESVHRADIIENSDDQEDEESADLEEEEDQEIQEKSDKKNEDHKDDDKKSEQGGGEEHEESHHSSENEKGEKGYKEWHEYDKGKKGHHDKENHEKEYDESKGEKKKFEDISGYDKKHYHDEAGNKEAEFGEKGEHQKGHSTKGQHVVHKKDEYEKKTEFYDESHEEDGDEKEGEYHYEHENKNGGHGKIGHHDSGYHVDKHGKKGEKVEGKHWDESKGHENKDGAHTDHHHEEKYGKKGGHEEGEKWSYKKGDNSKQR